jgi:hypothetical protein
MVFWPTKSQYNDAVLLLESAQILDPGHEGTAKLRFLSPEDVEGMLVPHTTFELREGARTVGGGTILETVSDMPMPPLQPSDFGASQTAAKNPTPPGSA